MTVTDNAPRTTARQALLEAAVLEFTERGYEQATLADIAERAGVTTGAIYGHFEGKLDLLVAALGLQDVGDFWREVAAAASLPWAEATVALSRGLSQRPDAPTLLVLDVIVLARRDPAVATAIRRTLDTYLRTLARATEEGAAAGVIDPALSPTDLARLVAVLMFGLLVLEALQQEAPSAGAFARLVDLLLQSHQPDDVDEPAALSRVATRSAIVDDARARQHVAIVEAAAEGFSLRRIGAAAGLSHERIRSIVNAAEAR